MTNARHPQGRRTAARGTSDPLSDVLRLVQFRAAVYYYVNLRNEWAVEASPSADVATAVLPGATHVMEFHVVAKGAGYACVEGQPPVRVATGDVVALPHGDPHVMCSHLHARPARRDPASVRDAAAAPRPIPITYHRGAIEVVTSQPIADAETILVCGFLGCKAKLFAPFVASLPRLLHVPAAKGSPWIAAVIEQAAHESSRRKPGGSALLERLSETMLVDTLRRHFDDAPAADTGWLAAARDRYVGNALAAIHARPAHAWTVEELGRRAGLSRSALHQRFVDVLGQTPGEYLARWRVQLGSELLRDTQSPVIAIAQHVGYGSEAAFSRAFKRIVGLPPAAWRRSIVRLEPRHPAH